ncbi:MAG: GTPase HflX, partial [Planctomycetales bacterium]|nr:GTPase HflX [Planctomycetales bacterium]
MQERDRFQSVASESAILARVIFPDELISGDPLDELEGLATTARTEVLGGIIQRREKPDNTTFMGKGKVDELKLLVDQ